MDDDRALTQMMSKNILADEIEAISGQMDDDVKFDIFDDLRRRDYERPR